MLRGAWGSWTNASGFLSYAGSSRTVRELDEPTPNSLLRQQLTTLRVHYEDTFSLRVTSADFKGTSAKQVLASVLEGFLLNAPTSVSNLMALRNVLIKPFGLRTSPLGCPVSSLLSPDTSNLFADQYPVLDQSVDAGDTRAQVILGANDKHLLFRSCVMVEIVDDHCIDISLGTRVHCKNLFGRLYMAAIDYVHRHYIAPTMLRLAVEFAVIEVGDSSVPCQLAVV